MLDGMGRQTFLCSDKGVSKFKPLASLDVVGHEFGHGITDFQIGWGGTFDQNAFNEGMSDIWGAILEQRIRPNNTWKIGEQVVENKPHLRNIQYTNDPNSDTKIADTFGSSQYNNTTDIYVRSGVLSHWFYIVANGESGTNDVSDTYSVSGIGLDFAEELIVEAVFNNYLDGTTTYVAIRMAFINAAETLFCEDSPEVETVTDAWYAVGVGVEYAGTVVDVSGATQLCTSSTYSVNAPGGTTTTWSISPSYAATFPSGSGSSKVFTRNGTYTGNATITADVAYAGGCTSAISKAVTVGTAITITANSFPDGSGGLSVTVGNGTGNYKYYKNGTLLLSSGSGSVYLASFGCSGGLLKVTCNTSCGLGELTRTIYQNCGGGGYMMVVYPNPTSSEVSIAYSAETTSEDGSRKSISSGPKSATMDGSIQLELYDFSANLFLKQNFEKSENVPSIDISDLKKGNYFLRIVGKEVDEIHQIVKE